MNRSKKFVYNTFASVFQQLIIVAVGLILPRTMLKFYGSEINGLTSSISQIINYFLLVEAGIGASAIYALYKPLADENYDIISAIVSASRGFYIKSGYFFTALVAILAVCFPFIRATSALSFIQIALLVFILGASGTLNFFILSKYNVLLTADQRSYVISVAIALGNIVSTIVIVVLAYAHMNVVVARAASLLSLLCPLVILQVYVRKKYRYLNFRAKADKSSMSRRWDALYLQILGIVQIGAPVILATIILDYKQVSVYAIFYMVIGGINGLLSVFSSGLSASFGDVIVRGDKNTLQRTYTQFEFTYYALITFVYACAFVLITPFVRIYTSGITDANYNVPLVGILMVINGFLYNLKTPQGMLVISAGLYRETRLQTSIQALILIIVGAMLAPKFGLAGIMVGSILSNVYRDIDLLFFIPKQVTCLGPRFTLKRWANSIITFFLILTPFYFVAIYALSYMNWIVYAAMIACYAMAVVFIYNFIVNREELLSSCRQIGNMLHMNRNKG